MSIQACILFLACAFYLGYFAESLEGNARLVMWAISISVAVIPIAELIYTSVRRFL